MEDTEVEDEIGRSEQWLGRKSRLEWEQGHEVSNRKKAEEERLDKRG